MKNRVFRLLTFLLFMSSPIVAVSQEWNPRPNWKDSYAVDGVCYCDSNGYDHNLDSKSADTPIGIQNVVDICETIERVMGQGSTDGRIPYNDIQCGNGPPNDAADELGCPGRVDIGPQGCDQIGPKWDLETAYADQVGQPQPPEIPEDGSRLDTSDWVITASHNNNQVNNMIDGSASSRWTTGTFQTQGQWIVIDLATTLSFDQIVLNVDQSPNDYPRFYSIFVSSNDSDWGSAVISGVGQQSVTNIAFDSQTARYIRIEQNGTSQRNWWSIHELEIFNNALIDSPVIESPTVKPTIVEWISTIISTLLMDTPDTSAN